jgi:hypothetical protein
MDMPEQLAWLRAAGFAEVDCFWLRTGHVTSGGYIASLRLASDFYNFSREVAGHCLVDRPSGSEMNSYGEKT